jgi:lysylphosphatidylglycerol synthetase-like protein (DUF2156 family)
VTTYARSALALLMRAPMTIAFIVLLWIVGAATGALQSGPPDPLLGQVAMSPEGLAASHWWAALSSTLWCDSLAGYLISTALLLVLGAPAERRLGAARTMLLFLISHVVGALAGTTLVRVGSDAGLWWPAGIAAEHALGPSIGTVGVGLALSFRLPALWRRRVRVLLLTALAMMALYIGSLEDVLRLGGGLAGMAAGLAVLGRTPRGPVLPSSRSETRTLIALVVAASAVGPLIAPITRNAFGPLTEMQFLFRSPSVDPSAVSETCADPASDTECRTLQAMVRAGGLGPAITSIVPVLVMMVAAEGLRRGRRFAWWLAMLLHLGFFALMGIEFLDAVVSPASDFDDLPDWGGKTGYLLFLTPMLLQPLAVAVVLLLTRHQFEVSAPRRTYRTFWLLVGATLLVTSTLDVLGGYLVRGQYSPSPGLVQLLADLPARFIPPGYLFLDTASFLPVGPLASILYDYTGVVFWTVTLVAVLLTFWRTSLRCQEQAATKARAILVEHGGSSLSYLTTWPGNHYWFSDDGRSAVAYRVVATVALTTGDPLGPPQAYREAFQSFASFCRRNGWTACFYSVTEQLKNVAVAADWRTVQVAEDTVLPLTNLTFTGKKWQDVRTALNKAAKKGVVAEWCKYSEAPLAITDQIRTISEEWAATKGLPEMGFTLGGLDELTDQEVRCLIAVDADRTVHGITSWLPIYGDGRPVGWTLDFMRRRAHSIAGSMEFLIASAALNFQEQGAEYLSLSGAPLARLDRGEQTGPAQRVLDTIGHALEPVYGFHSLLAFKAKFQPVYQPLYMIYQDPAALPTIANAISRAYLPNLTPHQTLQLASKIISQH